MPQYEHVELRESPVTPYDLVSSALVLRRRWPRLRVNPEEAKLVEEALEAVGLPRSVWRLRLGELSGGQLQRVLLARALVHRPPILLLDEPLSAIDPRGRAELAKLIGDLGEEKLVIVTSHDPVLLLRYTKGVVLLNRKVVAAGPPEEVLRLDMLRKVYGAAVLEVGVHPHICDSH
jgi:zinc/manganese transport system ATP-binding protein